MWRSEVKSGKLRKEGEVTLTLIVHCFSRLSVGMILRLINTKNHCNDKYEDHQDGQLTTLSPPRFSTFSFIFPALVGLMTTMY